MMFRYRSSEQKLSDRIEQAKKERRKRREEESRRQREVERRPLEKRIAFLEDRLSKLEAHVLSLDVKTKAEAAAEEIKETCLKARKSLLTDRDPLYVRGSWDPPEVWVVPLPEGSPISDASTTYLCQRRGTYTLHLREGGKDIEKGYVVLGVVT